MRYMIPVTITCNGDTAEQAAEWTAKVLHELLPQVKHFSTKFPAEVGEAIPRVAESAEVGEEILSVEDAAVFTALAESIGDAEVAPEG